jgi:hypothetical protein
VAELQEEATRVQAATVMAKTHAAPAERMAQKRAVLLATAHGEADNAAWRVFALKGELWPRRNFRACRPRWL